MNFKKMLMLAIACAASSATVAQTYTGTLSCSQSLSDAKRPSFEQPAELVVSNGIAQMKRSSDRYDELSEGRVVGQLLSLQGQGKRATGGESWTTKFQGTLDGRTFKATGGIYTTKGEKYRDCLVVLVNTAKPIEQVAPPLTVQKPVEAVQPAPAPQKQVADNPIIASFNCKKADSKTEKLICSNPQTAKLDANLGAAYKKALAASQNQEEFKKTQLAWIASVRDKSSTLDELNNAYIARINSLETGNLDSKTPESLTSPNTTELPKTETIVKPTELPPAVPVAETTTPTATIQAIPEATKQPDKSPSASSSTTKAEEASYVKYWITLALLLLVNAGYAIYKHRAGGLMLYQDYTDGTFAGAAPLLALVAFGLFKLYGVKTDKAVVGGVLVFLIPAWYVLKSTYRNNKSFWNFLVSLTAKITIVGAFYALMALYVISLFDSKTRRKGERRDSFDARLRREGVQTAAQMVATTAGFIGLSMWISKRGEFISIYEYCYPSKAGELNENSTLKSDTNGLLGTSTKNSIEAELRPENRTVAASEPAHVYAAAKVASEPNVTYQIKISGYKSDEAPQVVRQKLQTLLKANLAQVERLLAMPEYVLKKGLTQEQALAYQKAILNAGANCILQEESKELPLEVDLPPALQNTPLQAMPMQELPRPTIEQTVPEKAEANSRLNQIPEWFYESDGQRIGPISEASVSALIKSKQLDEKSSMWKQGFSGWQALGSTALAEHLDRSAPPPLQGDKVNNSIVWVLAFAPVIGEILQGFVAGIIYKNQFLVMEALSSGKFFYITVILNVVLALLDERKLQNAGYDTKKYKIWAWLLVPVYLFQRAKSLQQNLAYFIVWLVCFFAMLLL